MKILILGGTGFISSRLVTKLLSAGNEVHLFNRGRSKSASQKVRVLNGNRRNLNDLTSAASNKYDIIYDFIAYEPEDTINAVKAFKNKTSRFIHCSTISVYMISKEVTIPITEDQANAAVMDYWTLNPFGMGYGINKRRCEEILWKENSSSFPVTVIRPTFVCGPGDPARRDYFWIERINDGNPLLVPGTGKYHFQNIYVEDLASIFSKIIDSEVTEGKSYNAADEYVFTLNNYLELLADILGKKIKIVHCDQNLFDQLPFSHSTVADVFPFNTRTDAVFSLNQIKKDIGYSSTPIKEWMTSTVNWYLENEQNHSAGYNKRAEELKIIDNLQSKKQNKT